MPTTTLIVVRHGETEWNLVGRAQGHLNSPLTERGRTQADLLADGLVGKGIDVVISSDLGRAVETCEAITERLGLDYKTDPGLRERQLGIYQGLTAAEFQQQHPEVYARHKDPACDDALCGGETRQEHLIRCVQATDRIVQQHSGKTILLVCHGGTLACFFYHALGIQPGPIGRFSILNAAINVFHVTECHWELITWGDVSHLQAATTLNDVSNH